MMSNLDKPTTKMAGEIERGDCIDFGGKCYTFVDAKHTSKTDIIKLRFALVGGHSPDEIAVIFTSHLTNFDTYSAK